MKPEIVNIPNESLEQGRNIVWCFEYLISIYTSCILEQNHYGWLLTSSKVNWRVFRLYVVKYSRRASWVPWARTKCCVMLWISDLSIPLLRNFVLVSFWSRCNRIFLFIPDDDPLSKDRNGRRVLLGIFDPFKYFSGLWQLFSPQSSELTITSHKSCSRVNGLKFDSLIRIEFEIKPSDESFSRDEI
jgi:hypothetical protein